VNSVYNFLVDLMRVQRSLGLFVFFLDEDKKQIWYKNMEDFLSVGAKLQLIISKGSLEQHKAAGATLRKAL